MNTPFPEGPADGDVFFHNDIIYLYHLDSNTWEARRPAAYEASTKYFQAQRSHNP